MMMMMMMNGKWRIINMEDEDIKAILTHEQYSQNCFRLEDRQ